ncbi:MAG: hypothetical protein HY934_00890 [Candidatus Firestonebacteria bacterium]|nr:hypothetical protein [Candidatus Firestonebacteria bacterium]
MNLSQQKVISNKNIIAINKNKKINKQTEEMSDNVNKLVSKWSQTHITSLEDSMKLSNEIKNLIEQFVVYDNKYLPFIKSKKTSKKLVA